MSTRPEHVKVGPHWFQITFSAVAMNQHRKNTGDDNFGHTDFDAFAIELDDERPEQALKDTLVHEILHTINWIQNVKTTLEMLMENGGGKDADDVEEWMVGTMTTPLLGVLQENPILLNWLMETP